MPRPIVLLNAVGLTPRLLALAPRLQAACEWVVPVEEAIPAVTCTAQATILTGKPVHEHGIVANGWHFRDTNEVRFWQQSNRLIQAEPLYETLAKRHENFRCAKLFWWYNQGAKVEISITPKPWYGVDGNKVFGITGTPAGRAEALEKSLGKFPFSTFWGPMAGLPCTTWIARCAAEIVTHDQPDLTLVYLPHLDYEPQRRGPSGCDMAKHVKELDDACEPLLAAAKTAGAQVWLVSEYGHCDVSQPVYLNRVLAKAGFVDVRPGPFGDQLDLFTSRAFAVVDHQLAHVSIRHPRDVPRVRDLLAQVPGVDRVLMGDERAEFDLIHPRAGELVVLAKPNAWFAYNFWADDVNAPDYARAVAIHHKPGYDPCELFFDPALRLPKLRAARRLIQKKLGFRTIFDLVPLDAEIVRGSHGLRAVDPLDKPLFAGHGQKPTAAILPMTSIRDVLLNHWETGE
jgi:predicted AlkP superfamily pyrophosphatase or phosphodiesterase